MEHAIFMCLFYEELAHFLLMASNGNCRFHWLKRDHMINLAAALVPGSAPRIRYPRGRRAGACGHVLRDVLSKERYGVPDEVKLNSTRTSVEIADCHAFII